MQAYDYDAAGRLTAVRDTVDGPAGATCTIRAYEFHDATNRTAVHTAGADGDTCPAPPSSATRAWTSDAADRHTDTGYAADAFGRFTTVPAVDTPTGKALTIGYHANDLVRSLSDGARTTTYTLDVDQTRIGSWTDAGDGSTITRVHHYDGGGDAPAWTEENTTGPEAERYYTRNIGGDLSVIHDSATGSTFQVANLHGDVVGTTGADGTLTSANGTADEYGTPRDTATTGTRRYGWLGAKQRAADTPGGLTLMGVRLYNPTTGRFLSVDPIPGGNANPYEYCSGDPVNCVDLDGRWSWRKAGKRAVRWGKGLGLGGSACLGVFTGGCASISVNRYDGFTFTSGWTGRGRPGKRRVYYGISAGPAFSYQKRSVGNGWCGSVAMVGRCRDSKGNRQWWVNTPSKYMGAGVVSNRTRWQWRPWR